MRKFIITWGLVFVLMDMAIAPVFAQTALKTAAYSNDLQTEIPKVDEEIRLDNRVATLASFLEKYESPLASYSAVFIKAADTYGLDWRLVPAITGVESTFGKRIPYRSYNAYGWNNGDYKFQSWENSIWHVTRVLKEKYFDRGLQTVPQVARVYAPPSSTWAGKVLYFMNKIEPASTYQLNL